MPIFDLNLFDAKCSDGKSKSPLYILDCLDNNDQLFEL